jgi:hypothetical protein
MNIRESNHTRDDLKSPLLISLQVESYLVDATNRL